MTDNNDFFGEFAPHTRLKHIVLETYLEEWAFKLLRRPHAPSRVWYVDGFAGRGRDTAGNLGSPTIACQVAMRVRGRMLATAGHQSSRMGVFCIEERATHHAALAAHLEPFRQTEPALVEIRRGTLDQHLDAVLRGTSGPILAFLDPFGLTGLDAQTYAPLLERPGSEIFALVGTEGSKRLAAAYQSDGNKFAKALEDATSTLPLFPDEEQRHIESLRSKALAQNQRNDENREKNLASLTRALGSSTRALWVLEGDSDTAPARTATAFRDALYDAGAIHVTFLPVSDAKGRPKHLLVHATRSAKGVLAMKDAVSHALRVAELPEDLRARLADDLAVDLTPIVAAIRETYRGSTAPWARKTEGSVQELVYVNTPAFPHHRLELEAKLKAAGILRRSNGTRGSWVIAVPD